MRTLLSFLLALSVIASQASNPESIAVRTIYGTNLRPTDTIEVVIALRVGYNLRAFEPWTLLPGENQKPLLTGVREDEIVVYARKKGGHGEDWQYDGPDSLAYRFTPPLQGDKDRAYADRNGVNGREWVYGTPVRFAPGDTAYTIVIDDPSYCRGRAINGFGRDFNFMETLDRTMRDGYPEGRFRSTYGDTVLIAHMRDRVLHGHCSVKYGRVREAEGSFLNGQMHGPWIFKDHTRNWSFRLNYDRGVLNGWQVQRIDGVETKAYFENGAYSAMNSERLYKSNTRKR